MDVVQRYFQQQLPDYLRSLPIPSTPEGFLELSQDEALRLLPLGVFLFSLVLLLLLQLCGSGGGSKKAGRINTAHSLKSEKVVDTVAAKDIKKKVAYCRCWQSKKVRRKAGMGERGQMAGGRRREERGGKEKEGRSGC